jgi:hypothetical protein
VVRYAGMKQQQRTPFPRSLIIQSGIPDHGETGLHSHFDGNLDSSRRCMGDYTPDCSVRQAAVSLDSRFRGNDRIWGVHGTSVSGGEGHDSKVQTMKDEV